MVVVGAVPAFLTLFTRSTIPESPMCALRRGNADQARRSIAWALMCPPDQVELGLVPSAEDWNRPRFTELLRHPRTLALGHECRFDRRSWN